MMCMYALVFIVQDRVFKQTTRRAVQAIIARGSLLYAHAVLNVAPSEPVVLISRSFVLCLPHLKVYIIN